MAGSRGTLTDPLTFQVQGMPQRQHLKYTLEKLLPSTAELLSKERSLKGSSASTSNQCCSLSVHIINTGNFHIGRASGQCFEERQPLLLTVCEAFFEATSMLQELQLFRCHHTNCHGDFIHGCTALMLNSFSDLGVGLAQDRRGAGQLKGGHLFSYSYQSTQAENQLKDRLDEMLPAQPLTSLEITHINLLLLDT